jgi:hypothetical protein
MVKFPLFLKLVVVHYWFISKLAKNVPTSPTLTLPEPRGVFSARGGNVTFDRYLGYKMLNLEGNWRKENYKKAKRMKSSKLKK